MILGVVVLVLVLVGVLVARQVAGPSGAGMGAGLAAGAPAPPVDLDRWRAAGLLTAEQVAAIQRFEAAPDRAADRPRRAPTTRAARRASRVPLVAEALGYLGAILAGVGVVLVVAHYWDQLALGAQVALTAGASVVLAALGVAAGRVDDPALARMQALVWAASSATAGGCAAVVAHGGFDVDDPASVTFVVASVVGIHSAVLWRGRVRPLQQAIALIALPTAVGAALASAVQGGWWGAPVWVTGVALIGIGLARRGSTPELTEGIGAVAVVVGAVALVGTLADAAGLLFVVATALALVSAAFLPVALPVADRVILGGIGAAAGAVAVPAAISWFAYDGGIATGAVVWFVGAALVALGLTGRLHLPLVAQGLGSAAMLVGAGVVGAQAPGIAPALGLATAGALLALGTRPGAVLESLAGALGLLVYVPLAVARWFPGEGRAPVLLVVSGLLIVGLAVLIGRMGGRVRTELGSHPG